MYLSLVTDKLTHDQLWSWGGRLPYKILHKINFWHPNIRSKIGSLGSLRLSQVEGPQWPSRHVYQFHYAISQPWPNFDLLAFSETTDWARGVNLSISAILFRFLLFRFLRAPHTCDMHRQQIYECWTEDMCVSRTIQPSINSFTVRN